MKNRALIKNLLDINLDAEVRINLKNNFDYGNEEFSISYGGPNSGDGSTSDDAEFIYLTTESVDNPEH